MNRKIRIQQLRSLADHPGTPAHERASALARIAEMEAAPVRRPPAPPAAPSGAARLRGLRANARGSRAIPERWPFGWTGGRGPVEHELGHGPDGALVVGWKCPSCGEQVEWRVPPHVLRQLQRPMPPGQLPPLQAYLQRVVGGAQNQLCRPCWERWESA